MSGHEAVFDLSVIIIICQPCKKGNNYMDNINCSLFQCGFFFPEMKARRMEKDLTIFGSQDPSLIFQ